MKKALSFLLAVVFVACVFTSVPLTVQVGATDEGSCIFELNDEGNGYRVVEAYSGDNGVLNIPSHYNGLPVTSIDPCVLWNDYDVESITLPYTIKYIDSEAFVDCPANSITLNEGLEYIGEEAFRDCDNLKTIKIPSTVEYVDDGAFRNSGITSFSVASNSLYFTAYNGDLYSKDKTEFISYANGKTASTYTVPGFVDYIHPEAFDSDALIEIVVSEGVDTIGEYAFEGCMYLESVVLPESLTEAGWCFIGPFYNLKNVYFAGTFSQFSSVVGDIYQYICKEYELHFLTNQSHNFKSLKYITYKEGTASKYSITATMCTCHNQPIDVMAGTKKVCATPKLISAQNALDGIRVKFIAVDGADGYNVYRKVSGSKTWVLIQEWKGGAYAGEEDSIVDYDAVPGKTYTYTVRAVNEAGASGYNKTGVSAKRLVPPTLKNVYNNGSGNKLSWGKVTGASGYYIYRKTPNSAYKKIATIKKGSTTSYTDKKITFGNSYTYTVKAYSGKSISGYSVDGITISHKLPKVEITTTNVNGGKRVYLSCATPGATIYYKTSSKGSYKKYTGDFGLTSTKTVYAYATKSLCYKSSTASKKITVTKVKTPSVVAKNCVGGKKISFSCGTSGVTFYYKTSKNGSYVKYTEPFGITSTKTIYVKAYKPGYATSSTASKKVSVSKIGTPTMSSAKTVSASSIKVSWKKVSGAQGYYLYRATAKDGTYTLVHTITSGSTVSKTDTGLNPGTTYYYKVRAYCSGKATSSYSGYKYAKTKAQKVVGDYTLHEKVYNAQNWNSFNFDGNTFVYMNYTDDYLYVSRNGHLGEAKKLVYTGFTESVYVDGDYAYYVNYETQAIYKVNLSTGSQSVFCSAKSNVYRQLICRDSGNTYYRENLFDDYGYLSETRIYKVNSSGSQSVLRSESTGIPSSIYVNNGYLAYLNGENYYCTVDMGNGYYGCATIEGEQYYGTFGDWIYTGEVVGEGKIRIHKTNVDEMYYTETVQTIQFDEYPIIMVYDGVVAATTSTGAGAGFATYENGVASNVWRDAVGETMPSPYAGYCNGTIITSTSYSFNGNFSGFVNFYKLR